jgi:hypothetical protein
MHTFLSQVEENLQRVRDLQQEVLAGVRELQLPYVDFGLLQHHLDSVNQENTAQVSLLLAIYPFCT